MQICDFCLVNVPTPTHIEVGFWDRAMSLPLPKKGFHWKCVMPTEEQIMKMKWDSKKGWILEVELEYPEELHESPSTTR